MAIPYRGSTGVSTYFITASAFHETALLQSEKMASLLIDVLYHYREQGKFLLHGFVIMPDHIHLLITPGAHVTLERVMQFIKGGFSFRVKKELAFAGEVWQNSFYDRRVRDGVEFDQFLKYIRETPVKRGLVPSPGDYAFSSANGRFALDEVPQRLSRFQWKRHDAGLKPCSTLEQNALSAGPPSSRTTLTLLHSRAKNIAGPSRKTARLTRTGRHSSKQDGAMHW